MKPNFVLGYRIQQKNTLQLLKVLYLGSKKRGELSIETETIIYLDNIIEPSPNSAVVLIIFIWNMP
ncbi:hypothetical protein [Xanthovirga aplysinae]|uniref:hypothetical protein n=1 Tax=Xanthovirga aplysinae TaxID=2529853 RepID=UPI0016569AE9|nr:hypothetical protein [Xanthovirga aplysinae]